MTRICRTCLAHIWDEGGLIDGRRIDRGWSDRIERGRGDSLVCFSARSYRHEPIAGRIIPTHPAAYWHPESDLSKVWSLTADGKWHYNINGTIVPEDEVPGDLVLLGEYA